VSPQPSEMIYRTLVAITLTLAAGQKAGSLKAEKHPSLSVSKCSKAAGCSSGDSAVVIDANWRWIHKEGQPKNCYTGNEWDPDICPDVETCASNCVLEGADTEYTDTYGVHAQGNKLTLDFVTKGTYSKNIGSRTFLMQDDETYQIFKLKNREFTFTVDVSDLPCGLNGALYFVQMDADGGKTRFTGNEAGAKLGTGYCDAQCPHDLKFINGEPNLLEWMPSKTDPNAGTGRYGSCCVEMDIWEANSISTAYTAHSCTNEKQERCDGRECGDTNKGQRFDKNAYCDKNGCDLQTYRLGNTTFWGQGSSYTLDTSKPVTVVTQFVTADGTDTGKLTEIRRFYKQGSLIVPTPTLYVGSSSKAYSSLSTDYCTAERDLFADGTNFLEKGGMSSMESAFEKGMVLVMSIWDDHEANMLWLDSTYPTNSSKPGAKRGTCAITTGNPKDVESKAPNARVSYSDIRFGEIGSTLLSVAPAPALDASGTAAAAATCSPWERCAETPGCCPTGWECVLKEAAHASHSHCAPKAALAEAFFKTRPSSAAVSEFMADGTTRFPPVGLAA